MTPQRHTFSSDSSRVGEFLEAFAARHGGKQETAQVAASIAHAVVEAAMLQALVQDGATAEVVACSCNAIQKNLARACDALGFERSEMRVLMDFLQDELMGGDYARS